MFLIPKYVWFPIAEIKKQKMKKVALKIRKGGLDQIELIEKLSDC